VPALCHLPCVHVSGRQMRGSSLKIILAVSDCFGTLFFWERTGETRIARISTKLKPQRTHGTQRGTPEGGRSIETSRHFQRPHLARMPLAVEEDETLNSFPINLLGAEGVMFETHHFTTLVLQPQLGIGNEALDRALRPLRLVLRSKHRAKAGQAEFSPV